MDNKEFKWTDELASEFAYWYKNLPKPVCDPIIEFKKSKEVNKEYEILSFINTGGDIFELTDGYWYKQKGYPLDDCRWRTVEHTLKNAKGCEIYSIKRLLDNEVFTVGDNIKSNNSFINKLGAITSFEIIDNEIGVCTNEGMTKLKLISKAKEPLFTTEDGVPVYEWMVYWKVRLYEGLHTGKWEVRKEICLSESKIYPCDFKYFSTKEKAEEWVIMNKPCLSLNDLLENWDADSKYRVNKSLYETAPLFLNFKKVAKSKL